MLWPVLLLNNVVGTCLADSLSGLPPVVRLMPPIFVVTLTLAMGLWQLQL
jgi:uncharacterized membrane protein